MQKPKRPLPSVLWVAVIMLVIPVAAQACPSCVEALRGSAVGNGFNASILFLLGMPFFLVGSIGGGLFFYLRRHELSRQKEHAYGTAGSTI